MKKIGILLLALCLTLTAAACTTTNFAIPSSPIPWRQISTDYANTEISVYRIVKTDAALSNRIIGEGYLIATVRTLKDGDEHFSATEKRDMLTMETYLSYKDDNDVAEAVRGKTDRIVSTSVVTSDTLTPRFSTRTVTYDRGSDADGNAYYDYSCTVTNDYAAGTSVYSYLDRKQNADTSKYETVPAEKTLDFSGAKEQDKSRMVDNDFFYYYMRSMDIKLRDTNTGCGQSAQPGGTGTVRLFSPVDAHDAGSFKTLTMSYTCAADTEGAEVLTLDSRLHAWGAAEDGKIAGIKTSVSVTSGMPGSGTAIQMYFSEKTLKNDTASAAKVLLQFSTTEYARYAATGYYTFVAELSYQTTHSLCDFYIGTSPDTFDLSAYKAA